MCCIKSAIYLFSQGSLFGMQVLHISSTYEPLDIQWPRPSIKLREGRVWMTFGESSETSRESNLISSIKEEKKNSKPEIHARRNCLTEKVRYTKGQLFVWLILRLLQSNFSRLRVTAERATSSNRDHTRAVTTIWVIFCFLTQKSTFRFNIFIITKYSIYIYYFIMNEYHFTISEQFYKLYVRRQL